MLTSLSCLNHKTIGARVRELDGWLLWSLGVLQFGTGEGLLVYGMDARYRRGASCGTRRIFRSIRCKKQASVVRKGYSVPETPSYGTE